MKRLVSIIFLLGVSFVFISLAHATNYPGPQVQSFKHYLTKLEADYILSCQYLDEQSPAHGAINNIYGNPTWVVPRENGMAILGLIMAADILNDDTYLEKAQLAADYLVSIQDSVDGGWYDQYSYENPSVFSKSPTQTAEVMMALNKLGYDPTRYAAMKQGAQFLMACQDVVNKQGNDDGLIAGGKDENGNYYTWRWASDNSYGYWALKAAKKWAILAGETSFANICEAAAQDIISGINTYLYVSSDAQEPMDAGVWHRVVDEYDVPIDSNFRDWINYAPQMLDLPADGVGSAAVGEWIHTYLQKTDGACVWNNQGEQNRKSPGFSFQASLCWLDLGQNNYAWAAKHWAQLSGLWQRTEDPNGIKGGWIDWIENNQPTDWWLRFIDTSFYMIAVYNGGYDFSIQEKKNVKPPLSLKPRNRYQKLKAIFGATP